MVIARQLLRRLSYGYGKRGRLASPPHSLSCSCSWLQQSSVHIRALSAISLAPTHHAKEDEMVSQMIQKARSLKDEDTYAEAVTVLEEGLSYFSGADSSSSRASGRLHLALADIHSNRGKVGAAARVLLKVAETSAPLEITAAALEALTGLYLRRRQDHKAKENCGKLVDVVNSAAGSLDVEMLKPLKFRAVALQQLVELICIGKPSMGNDSIPEVCEDPSGAGVLAYAQFSHSQGNLSHASELYQKAIDFAKKSIESDRNLYSVMFASPEEVEIGALAGLGQLLSQSGEYEAAEEKLISATKLVEKLKGEEDINVGTLLSCIGDLYDNREKGSEDYDPIMTEAIYRSSLDLMKAPALDQEGAETAPIELVDIMALTRVRLADCLIPTPDRKIEAIKLRRWAEQNWKVPHRPFKESFPLPTEEASEDVTKILSEKKKPSGEDKSPEPDRSNAGSHDRNNILIDVRLGRVY